MSSESVRTAEYRRNRVRRLKKCIIVVRTLFILTPAVLCVFLFIRLKDMGGDLEKLTARVEAVAGENAALQEAVLELSQRILISDGSNQEQAAAGEKSAGYELTASGDSEGRDGIDVTGEGADVTDGEEDGSALTAAHKVYLTFDDGPSSNTEKILDILDEYDVKATFFVVGKEGEWAREALKDIVKRGHTLGMHSYSHRYADIYSSVEDFAEDFVKLRGYLEEVTGVVSDVYRFPGGSSNTVSDIDMHEFAEYLESWNVRFFDWNAASGDGGRELLTVDALVKNSLEGIEKRENTVILLHDAAGKPTTVEALPEIIENILAMEDTVILPITEDTEPVQHIHMDEKNETEVN